MNEVAMKKENAVAVNMFEADADKGSQNMTQEDLALPFLKVLGQLSPEVNKRDGKYVEGAEPGMILNTVTNEVFDGTKGIDVLPVFYERKYVEWQDRGEGKGAPVAIHDASSDIMSQTTRDKSFKDSFRFLGTRTSQNAQVGNAVPPLLAFKIAKELIKLIK